MSSNQSLPELKASIVEYAKLTGVTELSLCLELLGISRQPEDAPSLAAEMIPCGWSHAQTMRAHVAALQNHLRQMEGPQGTDEQARDLVLVRADQVKIRPVEWIWNQYLPLGMLTIFGGAPGTGKTSLALYIAAIVTTGGRWPDGTPCRFGGNVLIWSGEDHQSVLAARLAASGADLTKVFFIDGISGPDGGPFDPAKDWTILRERALDLKPRLILVDPIVSAVAGDGHKSNEVRRGLQPLVDLGHDLNCAVIGITHFSKGTQGRDTTERITGSIAFGALARVVLVAARARVEEGETPYRVFLRSKSNIGPDDGGFKYDLIRIDLGGGNEGQTVQWGDQIAGDARTILAEAEGEGQDKGDRDEDRPEGPAEAWLREVLADGPVAAKDVLAQAKEAGMSRSSVHRAKDRLRINTMKAGMIGGWVWVPPWLAPEVPSKPLHSETLGATGDSGNFRDLRGPEKPRATTVTHGHFGQFFDDTLVGDDEEVIE